MTPRPHLLFGDHLGPHFAEPAEDGPDEDAPLVMIESRAVFRRRRFHRAKAHLVLSAMRHRAAELGDRVRLVRADTYLDGLRTALPTHGRRTHDSSVTVHHPTSHAALSFASGPAGLTVLPARGFLLGRREFDAWRETRGDGPLRMEDFYRHVRRDHDLLMDGDQPTGGRWNFDHDNREPPPRDARTLGVPAPWTAEEDEIDDEVRHDLDRWERDGDITFLGEDGPRIFPASRREALDALTRFLDHRLAEFGRYEDAILAEDPWMSHSLLSVPLNLGLLDPAECVEGAVRRYRAGAAPLASVEGFVRQVAGWREYVWHLYWHFGDDYRRRNALLHRRSVPTWFAELDSAAVTARCLSTTLEQVRRTGWVHHIPRLMVLGSHALQSGWNPAEVTDWFHRAFVDGYDWVMVPNVVGMSQYADGGRMTTKPYTSGGAYIHRMSDLCGGCAYRPGDRVGERACPYTAGYWAFLDRHRERLAHNHRMSRPVAGLDRLDDLPELLEQERRRGSTPP
ncbi:MULTISPECIES: cryptochrome/photolyase family protein [unclassified Streptomyces]|uniref:cryptochrome/photolyase family protein n=1 Tax=unclassified Streptomyces TaxID=2593676 RepID=UPI000CD557F2|nr:MULTISPECIES: cryptochrome/photolyase family protein [unclassified Streptomyces]